MQSHLQMGRDFGKLKQLSLRVSVYIIQGNASVNILNLSSDVNQVEYFFFNKRKKKKRIFEKEIIINSWYVNFGVVSTTVARLAISKHCLYWNFNFLLQAVELPDYNY